MRPLGGTENNISEQDPVMLSTDQYLMSNREELKRDYQREGAMRKRIAPQALEDAVDRTWWGYMPTDVFS